MSRNLNWCDRYGADPGHSAAAYWAQEPGMAEENDPEKKGK